MPETFSTYLGPVGTVITPPPPDPTPPPTGPPTAPPPTSGYNPLQPGHSFAIALCGLLQPMFYADALEGNDLNTFLYSIGDELFQIVEDWASDSTVNGKDATGYSVLLDADRVPPEVIPWLAQFVGAQITSGLTPTQQQAQLVGLGSWKRGTVGALQAAPLPYLTGSQTVLVKERDIGAYHFQVVTLASETTDSNAILAALLAQKPAGLAMSYIVFAGQKAFTMRNSVMRGTVPDSLRLSI